jgi:hypothetical protein
MPLTPKNLAKNTNYIEVFELERSWPVVLRCRPLLRTSLIGVF